MPILVTEKLLTQRVGSGKYGVSAWIKFCRHFMALGYKVMLHEAQTTKSKYVFVYEGKNYFKVRFSDHPPGKGRLSDCDFFVGPLSKYRWQKMEEAIEAVLTYFRTENRNEVLQVAPEEQDQAAEEVPWPALRQLPFAPEWPYDGDRVQEVHGQLETYETSDFRD